MDRFLEGHFLFSEGYIEIVSLFVYLWTATYKYAALLLITLQGNLDWPSSVSCLFKGFKLGGLMQQNNLFWNSQWRDCPSKVVEDGFRMLSSSVLLFEDQISGIPLLWAAPRGGNNLQQEICSLSSLWPTYNQAFLLPITDSLFLVVIAYLPWSWWDSEKVQIKVWREAPQMQTEDTACLSRWRGRELSHKLVLSGPPPPPIPALSSVVLSCAVLLLPRGSPWTQVKYLGITLW